MAGIVSASPSSSWVLQYSTINKGTQLQQPICDYVYYPRVRPLPMHLSGLSLTRRRNHIPAATSDSSNRNRKIKTKNKKKPNKSVPQKHDKNEKILDDNDPIEALFRVLEEDLKNDFLTEDVDDELTEEDLANLERELEEALGNDDELSGMGSSNSENTQTDDDVEDEDEDGDGDEDEDADDDEDENEDEDEDEDGEEERPVELKKWQLRRLASALKIGRRKTSIKSLAAELCLDRAVVLELLRKPPPDLLLLSASLPDRVVPTTPLTDTKRIDPSTEVTQDVSEPEPEPEPEHEPEGKLPVHAMQSRWMMQKRLKKVQVETLERVYNRTKRPTNTMISSIVHVTNLPRKRVVQWFEDKRAEDEVPHKRLPFGRSTSETILTN